MPTTIISTPNSARSWAPSIALATIEPANAPTTPAAAKVRPQRHFTVPARQWPSRLAKALAATASALVPMATWVEETPTP